MISQWQPIETAPRSGSVIVWDESLAMPRVAFYATSFEDGDHAWVYARQIGDGDKPPLAFIVVTPTHWMPIPEPPK